ncbi:MAG TPA: DUF1501 domain-containing protein, partial [Deltaproteobacteria bacterium]|nr:DUF1501 domain-containing protein [Deltaproteobacteria bacterium]
AADRRDAAADRRDAAADRRDAAADRRDAAADRRDAAAGHAPGPSVLIVLWDTVRADRLSLYGHDRPTTPRLDALAPSSRVYEAAMSPGMWTVPAHGSLFTGLPASTHGARVGWLWLDAHHLTLAEHLSAQGYATYAWSSNPYLSEQTNLLQGFDTTHFSWRGDDALRAAAATRSKLIDGDRSVEISPAWIPSGHGRGWPGHLTAVKDAAPVIVESFLSWVDELQPDAPFLAYLNFLEAHHPRVPSARSRAAVAPPDVVQRSLSADLSLFRLMAAMEGRGALQPDEIEALAATYDASLRDLDEATGELIDGLAARGRLDDTVVVVVSDHGEHLGEGGRFDHRWSVDQELLHVPLLIRYPAGVAPGREPRPVSTRHLFGTLLQLTGADPPAGAALPTLQDGLQGTDPIVSELVASTPRLPQVRRAFPDLDPTRWRRRFKVWFGGDLKYVLADDDSQRLHDLSQPRPDAVDLAPQRPEVAAAHRGALQRWDRARPRYRPELRTPTDHPGQPMADDGALIRQLEQLGYTAEDE